MGKELHVNCISALHPNFLFAFHCIYFYMQERNLRKFNLIIQSKCSRLEWIMLN